jgi:hypothetical protein
LSGGYQHPPIQPQPQPQPAYGYGLQEFNDYDYQSQQQSYLPQIPDLPPAHAFGEFNSQPAYIQSSYQTQPQHPQPYSHQPQEQQQPQEVHYSYAQPGSQFKSEGPQYLQSGALFKSEEVSNPTNPPFYEPGPTAEMSARVKRERKENGSAPAANIPGAGPSQGIEVKTKFPVARIKRIMQADEEVGKVAQVTPVAVCKS